MRITALGFLILVNQALAGGGGGKHHVHFKIHVPEIIKHHIHTKTVFIHVHSHGHGGHHGGGGKKKMVPKKKETHHEESHHEDWSSWSSYDVHGGHGNGHEHKNHGMKDTKTSVKGHPIHGGHFTLGGYGHELYGNENYNPHKNPHAQMLAYDPGQLMKMHMQDYLHSQFNSAENSHHPAVPPQNLQHVSGGGGAGGGSGSFHSGGGVVGYSYPPQYAGMQNSLEDIKHVKEPSHNDIIEPYTESYEDGYRKGFESQTGHILQNDMKNFYDDKFEEGDFSNNGYGEQSFDKYKTHEDLENDDSTGSDHDGYNNYHNTHGDSYLSSIRDTK